MIVHVFVEYYIYILYKMQMIEQKYLFSCARMWNMILCVRNLFMLQNNFFMCVCHLFVHGKRKTLSMNDVLVRRVACIHFGLYRIVWYTSARRIYYTYYYIKWYQCTRLVDSSIQHVSGNGCALFGVRICST